MNSNRNFVVVLISLILLQALLVGLLGVTFVNAHESDVLHLLEGATRMADGERPHLDFMTPLGLLSFAPTALLLQAGFGGGAAIALSGVLVAILLFPAMLWTGISRLNGRLSWGWAAAIVFLITASIYGGTEAHNSYSMMYNRWGWAVSFIVLTLVMLPNSGRKNEVLDGVVTGFAIAFLALLKVTFFVGVFPAVVLILLISGSWRTLVFGALTGVGIALIVTLWAGGFLFWFSYFDNLVFVNSITFGDDAGGWAAFTASPRGAFAVIAILVAVGTLSSGGKKGIAIALMMIAPGFVYITYNNWGSEPKYLVFIGFILLASLTEHRKKATALAYLMIGSMIVPLLNIGVSNLRVYAFDTSDYMAISEDDLLFSKSRVMRFSSTINATETPVLLTTVTGEQLAIQDCIVTHGILRQDLKVMEKLLEIGLVDSRILLADTFSNFWLSGVGTRLIGGAIWQYGGAFGIDSAEVLVVTNCVASVPRRNGILQAVKDANLQLDPLFTEDGIYVYRILKD